MLRVMPVRKISIQNFKSMGTKYRIFIPVDYDDLPRIAEALGTKVQIDKNPDGAFKFVEIKRGLLKVCFTQSS